MTARRAWAMLGIPLLLAASAVVGHGRVTAPALSRVPTTAKVVALTFDDGPAAPYTGKILKLLTRYGDAATFFVVGQEAHKFPALVKAEQHDGMEVALHGLTHLNLQHVGARFIVDDAIREQAYLRTLIPGARLALYRTPYGYRTPALEQALARAHLTLVLWDVDTRDWARPGVGYIIRQVERLTKPGSILLFHDGGGNRSQTVAALAVILPWLKQQGYRAVTISQLIQSATG